MIFEWMSFFTDPILRAPTIGCMLMGLTAGIIGMIVFLRKESLLGETLSHAAYPGAILGALFAAFFNSGEDASAVAILTGAALSGYACVYIIRWMITRLRIPSDAALCFTLASTFGIGIALASHMQFIQPSLYRRMLSLFYGQAATMTDFHIAIYGILAFVVICAAFIFRKEIQVTSFDKAYASSLGIPVKLIEGVFFALTVLAVIIGIRTVGVVLMSAMLIAPPAAARQFSNSLSTVFLLAAFFGIIAGFLGNYISVNVSQMLAISFPGQRLSLPTGPMIVLTAASICLAALLFAPERGLFSRAWRIARFRYRCLSENILKCIWRNSSTHCASLDMLSGHLNSSYISLRFALYNLEKQGWIASCKMQQWRLTPEGSIKAANIVRLHRLWEVYLADYLGMGSERVHRSAEEMEHIITPELEKELTKLLNDPKVDPHKQPIPGGGLPLAL